MNQNQRGFTLIEAMIVIGITSIAAASLSSVLVSMYQGIARANQLSEAEQLSRILDKVLQNQSICEYNLKDTNIPVRTIKVGDATQVLAINKIEMPSGATIQVMAERNGSVAQNLWIKEIGFRNFTQIDDSDEFLGEMFFEVTTENPEAKEVAFHHSVRKRIPIFLGTNWTTGSTTATITACSTSEIQIPDDDPGADDPPPGLGCKPGDCKGIFGPNFPDKILCNGTIYYAVRKGDYRCTEGGAKSTRSAYVRFSRTSGEYLSQRNRTRGACGSCPATSLSNYISSGKAY